MARAMPNDIKKIATTFIFLLLYFLSKLFLLFFFFNLILKQNVSSIYTKKSFNRC
jgi:hypothetical protein